MNLIAICNPNNPSGHIMTPKEMGAVVSAAIVFVRYQVEASPTELCDRLNQDHSTYVVPGDHFGLDGYMRIGFGLPEDYLLEGLDRVAALIESAR